MKYAAEIMLVGGCIGFLVSGVVSVMAADAIQGFVSGMMFSACELALNERVRRRFVCSAAERTDIRRAEGVRLMG